MKILGFSLSLCLLIITIQLMDAFATIGNASNDTMVKDMAFAFNMVIFVVFAGVTIAVNYYTGVIKSIIKFLKELDIPYMPPL